MSRLGAFCVCVLAAAACKTAPRSAVLPSSPPAPAAPSASSSGAEGDVRSSGLAQAPRLAAVRFTFDSYALGPEARKTLREHVEALGGRGPILIEGHCDDQGTDAYNLALAQRRAKAVRDYLLMSGVPADRVATIAYGEERPLCFEPDEACRSRNRRAEIRLEARDAEGQGRLGRRG